jgi:hypothetical protein
MELNPLPGISLGIGVGFVVDAVHAVDGAQTLFNPLCLVVQHFEILKIEESAALAGNEHHRFPPVSVDLEFHVPVQGGTVVLCIFNLHIITPDNP